MENKGGVLYREDGAGLTGREDEGNGDRVRWWHRSGKVIFVCLRANLEEG